ncbi:MAG: AbrB/MazE/SpoVT family DNA-binding domain-containing protein [Nanoarchaeota archaeon]
MRFKRELGVKGQVVIPKDIREFLGIKRRGEIVFEIQDNNVLLKPEQDIKEFVTDFFNVSKMEKPLTMKKIKKSVFEQYDHEIS